MGNFSINLAQADGAPPVIVLGGEVDVYTAPQLKQQMIDLLGSGAKEIVVDLTKVYYLDSTALGVLIGGCKKCRESDGDFAVVCPNPKIRRVFEITGLDKIFEVCNTAEDAAETIRVRRERIARATT